MHFLLNCPITTIRPTFIKIVAVPTHIKDDNAIVKIVVPVVFVVLVPVVLLIFFAFFFYRRTKKSLKKILHAHFVNQNNVVDVDVMNVHLDVDEEGNNGFLPLLSYPDLNSI